MKTIKKVELIEESPFDRINQPKYYRLALLISSLFATLGTGYFIWREVRLDAAEQLMFDCIEQQNCSSNISTIQKLAKAKRTLMLLNFENANLQEAHLPNANFNNTNLKNANLSLANLKNADLKNANLSFAYLINTKHLKPTQIKSACHWQTAFYQGDWDSEQAKWVVNEQANQQYIEQLKLDKTSEPKEPIDCSRWK